MRLHARAWGPEGGPSVLCLHGVGRTGELFCRLAEETLPEYRVTALDLRGHGESPHEPPWGIRSQARDVLDTVGDTRPHLWIGHSFGGRLVIELAGRHPSWIPQALLLDPAIRVRPDIALAEANGYLDRRDQPFAPAAAAAMLGELAGEHARVEALTMPTLLVVPREGGVVGPRQLAWAEGRCPDLTVARVGGDHHVLETAFDETAAAVRAFLS